MKLFLNPMELFIPKKGLLGNFLIDDYHNVQVDFERYDKLSMSKDPNRKIKPHQKEAVQFLLSRKKCILADDMGLGKSLELSANWRSISLQRYIHDGDATDEG